VEATLIKMSFNAFSVKNIFLFRLTFRTYISNEKASRCNKTELTTSTNKVITILRDTAILLASLRSSDTRESKKIEI